MAIALPNIDPIALRIGPLAIHWYGLTYLLGFGLAWLVMRHRLRQQPWAREGWQRSDSEDILFYAMLGVILGGRLGYVLFYKPLYYFSNPLAIFAVWQGGMSFHGGMLGVILGMVLLARRKKRSWLCITDFIAPAVPLALASGRIGNFINGELYGRAVRSDVPWAMIFQTDPLGIPRHPSQLYQFALEGLTLFIVLWLYARRERARGLVSALFLLGYGLLRFIAEYFRQPDAHLGYLALGMTMGQWLCVPMIGIGAVWFTLTSRPSAKT